jgi:hypothetical protein
MSIIGIICFALAFYYGPFPVLMIIFFAIRERWRR